MDKPLSPLQKQFFDLLNNQGHVNPENEKDLIADIRTMDAIELRENISVFMDTGENT